MFNGTMYTFNVIYPPEQNPTKLVCGAPVLNHTMVMCVYSVILVEWDCFCLKRKRKKEIVFYFCYWTQSEIFTKWNRPWKDPDMSLTPWLDSTREVGAQALSSPFAFSLDTFLEWRQRGQTSQSLQLTHNDLNDACRYFSFGVVTT